MSALLRLQKGDRLILATHNAGKVVEMAALLAPFGVAVDSAAAYNLVAPAETAADFIGNATIKSKAATLATGLPALADDSGLVVDALAGAPGIHSARWAERPAKIEGAERPAKIEGAERGAGVRDFAYAMQRVQDEMALAANKTRNARFICALSLSWVHDAAIKTAAYEGCVEGTIITPPRGTYGFGYDPIFLPDNHTQSFGEMLPSEKHALSHRADAFAQLIDLHFD
ncbi:MAG: non-canonical purine NTP pyrophosphatase [Alphaproteobacteria bacterium]|nr:non-canonical purine NTP pyrophosphatase [Alphaproteobacteria bacterium]